MIALDRPIYAISGYAEWFYCMCRNWKDIENRDWSLDRHFKPSDLPVRVYLHASKKPASKDEIVFIRSKLNKEQLKEFDSVDWAKLRGQIIGETTITGQTQESKSVWFFGKFGFMVKDGILYDKFIPYKGWFGFFRFNISGEECQK
jgi:hypothetical protein